MPNYYAVLGVTKQSTQDEIKSAYRKLAKEHHPDRHTELDKKKVAEEKFKEVAEAYEIIGDPDKRANYDRPQFNPFSFDFARNWETSQAKAPRDITASLEMDLIDAANGGTRKIALDHEVPCADCDGTGSTTKKTVTCNRCGGCGQQTITRGFFSLGQTCSACRGTGQLPEATCPACKGNGERMKNETIEIKIPAGVDTRHILRVPGMGRHGGDLKIFIIVKPHPKFQRVGNDLYCSIDIPFMLALKGGKTTTTGLNGEMVELEIPRGIAYGDEVIANGKGVLNGYLKAKTHYKIPCLDDETISKLEQIIPS